MKAATYPRPRRQARTLMVDEPEGRSALGSVDDLGRWLKPGDLLVLNDAATLPASLTGTTASGEPIEIRLAGRHESRWWAALLGAGDWRVPTEQRPAPPAVVAGQRLLFGPRLGATVERVCPPAGRRLELTFEGDESSFWRELYAVGRPIQYAYQPSALPLHAVQTPVAQMPFAVEMPSAAWGLTWSALARLKRAGVQVAWLTHASGLSSIGEEALDATLPWPERFTIPAATVDAIARAQGRVVAVGTSVVRALETAGRNGWGPGPVSDVTHLRIASGYRRRVVDGLLTNVHVPGESHYDLLRAFAAPQTLDVMEREAMRHALLQHEHGDTVLLLGPSVDRTAARQASAREALSA